MRQRGERHNVEPAFPWRGLKSHATGNGPHAAHVAAFTTIEMLAVLVLIAIVSAAAVLSLGASLRTADLESALDAIAAQDQSARELARRQAASLRLRFDPSANSIDIVPRGEAKPTRSWELPADYRIERVVLRAAALPDEAAQVVVSPRGWSQPYALLVSGRGRSGWIVFGGFTGRAARAKDEADVQEQLGLDSNPTSAGRNDAR